ncbi:hypothetical protein Tco_0935977 [Tanacetum coccineum]
MKSEGEVTRFGCIRSGLREIRSHSVVVFNDIINGRGCFDDDLGCCLGDVGVGVKGGNHSRLLLGDEVWPMSFRSRAFD